MERSSSTQASPFSWRGLAADSTLALGIKVLSLPVGYLTAVVIARVGGAGVLGTFTLAVYLVTTLSVLCRLGLDTGMLRFIPTLQTAGHGGEAAGLYWQGLALVSGLSGAAALGLYLARDWLMRVFHAPALPELLSLVTPALPVLAVVVFSGETLRSLGGVRWVVAQQDFLSPFSLLLLVGAWGWWRAGASTSLTGLGLAFLLSSLLSLAFLALALAPHLKSPRISSGPSRLRELMRYSWPLYLSALFMLSFGALDSLVLGLFTRPEAVAYYESASRTAFLVSLPLMAVNAVVPPLFARLHHKEGPRQLEELARGTSRWMYLAALPLAMFTISLAPEILGLFGPGFEAGKYALAMLALAQLVNVACGSVGFLLAMTGHQVTLTLILGGGGALGVPLMAAGAALAGLDGLALVKGLWVVGVNCFMSLAVWRRLGIKVLATRVAWPTVSGLAAAAILWLARPYLGPWAAAALGGLSYLAFIRKTLYQEFLRIGFLTAWEAQGESNNA